MDQDIKRQWVTALLSGDYKQGKKALRSDDKFCCWGVLCDLHAKHTGAAWARSRLTDGRMRYGDESSYPPCSVREWAGVTNEGSRIGGNVVAYLASLNDTGSTFDEISQVIENNL